MNRKPHLLGFSQHEAISRVLSGLLLVFVIYGTTIEAAHRHGRILTTTSNDSSFSHHENSSDLSGGGSLSCAECPICQLHQQFSSTLVTVWDNSSLMQTSIEVFHAASSTIPSRSQAPNPGRAPPFNS